MFGVEFMVGGVVISLLNTLLLVLALVLVVLLSIDVIKTIGSDKPLTKWFAFRIVSGVLLLFIFITTFSSAKAPKVKIETGPNYSLQEYQNQDDEVVINTPEPRYENLEGFEPLKDR